MSLLKMLGIDMTYLRFGLPLHTAKIAAPLKKQAETDTDTAKEAPPADSVKNSPPSIPNVVDDSPRYYGYNQNQSQINFRYEIPSQSSTVVVRGQDNDIDITTGNNRDHVLIFGSSNEYKIDTGSGNDYVFLQTNSSNGNVNLGKGDDEVVFDAAAVTASNAVINGGLGNDTFRLLNYTTSNNQIAFNPEQINSTQLPDGSWKLEIPGIYGNTPSIVVLKDIEKITFISSSGVGSELNLLDFINLTNIV